MSDPPEPFEPRVETLAVGSRLYRVLTATQGRSATAFNPGLGSPTRFAFFGSPLVPVMYAAERQDAAIAETLLHDIPVAGGVLPYSSYASQVMARVATRRPLTLAALYGLGLRQLQTTAAAVTATGAADYHRTVNWAAAAHACGLDGLVWMSRQCNDAKAYVFFGDRCDDAFSQDNDFGRIFATGRDQQWLIEICAPLQVDVLLGP